MKKPLLSVFNFRFLPLFAILFYCISGSAQVSFTNSDTIFIQDGAVVPIPGKPYPSEINVQKQKGLVTHVSVTLIGLEHNFPDGIDLMLVAPDGTNSIILSDVGGAADISGVTVTLDDDNESYLPDKSVIRSGIFKPTNEGNDIDLWPGDAPAPSGANDFSQFMGIDPNGIWRLYAVSDQDGTYGMVTGGWKLTLDIQKKIKKTEFRTISAFYNQSEKEVLLAWQTENEFNLNSFSVERAEAGSGWQTIAEMEAAGFTDGITTYEYKDISIEKGRYAYRVKMHFKDGSTKTSTARSVEVKSITYAAYPNPARNFTYIISDSRIAEQATVTLKDVNNNIIAQHSGLVGLTSPMRFDFQARTGGVHYLIIATQTGQEVKTLYVMK